MKEKYLVPALLGFSNKKVGVFSFFGSFSTTTSTYYPNQHRPLTPLTIASQVRGFEPSTPQLVFHVWFTQDHSACNQDSYYFPQLGRNGFLPVGIGFGFGFG